MTGTPPATSVKVGDLDPGPRTRSRSRPRNGSGTGPLSAASNAVTPNAPVAPGAPTGLVAGAANQQATVRWTAPNDGGRTITRYTVTPYLGGVAQPATTVTGSPAPTTRSSTGLANGSAYTFTVSRRTPSAPGPTRRRRTP